MLKIEDEASVGAQTPADGFKSSLRRKGGTHSLLSPGTQSDTQMF